MSTIISDLGGVLIPDPIGLYISELKQDTHVDRARLIAAFENREQPSWHDAACGYMPAGCYLNQILEAANCNSMTGEELALRLASRACAKHDKRMFVLLKSLKTAGHQLGLLSNSLDLIGSEIRLRLNLDRLFDAIVFSYEVRCKKPEPKIYEIMAHRLGGSEQSYLFIDNQINNMTQAVQRGWTSYVFVDFPTCHIQLKDRFHIPPIEYFDRFRTDS